MNINELRYNIRRMWSKFGLADISASKNGQYMFKFRNEEGLNAVTEKGPWMETRLKSKKLQHTCDKVFQEIHVQVINITSQSMLYVLSANQYKIKCFYTFLYAANEGLESRELWTELRKNSRYVNGRPWGIAGDLNETLSPTEHSIGGSTMTTDMVEFHECVNKIEVEDICGDKFSHHGKCDVGDSVTNMDTKTGLSHSDVEVSYTRETKPVVESATEKLMEPVSEEETTAKANTSSLNMSFVSGQMESFNQTNRYTPLTASGLGSSM
ncbi:RNA-directed DNA polymerase, eukaryota, Reverse transcriptase zinc-binding domain protein [Artemisia annua]|uniref:RNA-directed DNA polymerase, eukaryota, Reverse transcriptase zinc-binding domain protein n=1 Tax=Artemisia annua TaxID=35608 RepID=A0A2U1PHM5_ARTAN|nr:RNA-directed DNA polymerase, eukaryota, Reverse transcriptase zinc-binding domain protein [Artemisia annua]